MQNTKLQTKRHCEEERRYLARNDVWLIILLLLLSSLIIFYKFSLIPKNISFDEVDFAKLALSLNNKPYSVYSPLATGHSTLYFYILLASLKLFGISSFALRLPSALFGVLNVIVVFLLMRKIFNDKVNAVITTLIFITMHWYFNFARFSFEATFLLFLELVSTYFIFLFFEKKNKSALIVSAVFTGLVFHSYYPGRIFFLLPVLWIFIKSSRKNFFLFLVTFGIIIAPLVTYNFLHSDMRVSQISFLSDPKISIHYKVSGVASNIFKTILMPFWRGDMNGRHNFPGKPALNPILSIFFLLGIYLGLKGSSSSRMRGSINASLFFLSYLLISIIPAILTSPNDNPTMLRTFTMIPAIIYFIAIALSWIYNYISKQKHPYILSLLFFFLIFTSSIYELRTYFSFQSRVFNNSFEVNCELKDVVNKPTVPKSCRVQKNMF